MSTGRSRTPTPRPAGGSSSKVGPPTEPAGGGVVSRRGMRITRRGWVEIARVLADHGATVEPVICDRACLPETGEHHRHLTEYGHRELRRILLLAEGDFQP